MALFKQESASGANPELKLFAYETLPTLEQHRSMAKELRMISQ